MEEQTVSETVPQLKRNLKNVRERLPWLPVQRLTQYLDV